MKSVCIRQIGFTRHIQPRRTMTVLSTPRETLETECARKMRASVRTGRMPSHMPKAIQLVCLDILECAATTPLEKRIWSGFLEVARIADSHEPL